MHLTQRARRSNDVLSINQVDWQIEVQCTESFAQVILVVRILKVNEEKSSNRHFAPIGLAVNNSLYCSISAI